MKNHTTISPEAQLIMTVQGPVHFKTLGTTDGHNHVWIEAVPGADAASPVLDQFDLIVSELTEYYEKGGRSLLDCQPNGCGRNGNRLLALSKASGVNIVACTGFHRRKYYPSRHWFWNLNTQQVFEFLVEEIEHGLRETTNALTVKAGFIKIALETNWEDCPKVALEGAAAAACETHMLIEIHTEKGALAEEACQFFTDRGVSIRQLVLCHMDKRSDPGLHKELAAQGVLLEYDTFYRQKYHPEKNLWPLIETMVDAGFAANLVLATDMAEANSYHFIGNGPGLASLPGEVRDKLIKRGISESARSQMLGGNIARRLAGIY